MNASEASSRTRKKRGPLFWVLISVASFLVLLMIAGGVVSYFALRSFEQRTGMDAAAMKQHPVRGYVLSDNENEIISEDSVTGDVRYRNKKTGEESITSLDPRTQRFVTIRVTPPPETK